MKSLYWIIKHKFLIWFQVLIFFPMKYGFGCIESIYCKVGKSHHTENMGLMSEHPLVTLFLVNSTDTCETSTSGLYS
jgi:hypothetical protein